MAVGDRARSVRKAGKFSADEHRGSQAGHLKMTYIRLIFTCSRKIHGRIDVPLRLILH